jgi:adenylate cyclase
MLQLPLIKRYKENEILLTEDEPFRICVGIGYGYLLCSETLEGHYGDQMNITSKLGEDIASGNEILLTEPAYADISDQHKQMFRARQVVISDTSLTCYETKV